MAFHWPTFRTRALTAIVFAAVMLAGLLWSWWSFLLLFSVIHFGCWVEYFRLLQKINGAAYHINFELGLMVLGYGLMLYVPEAATMVFEESNDTSYFIQLAGYMVNIKAILILAGTLLTMIGTVQQRVVTLRSFGQAIAGLLYISLSWGMMLDLYAVPTGNITLLGEGAYAVYFPLMAIGCMWVNDTMAYIVGSLIGKTPFSKISPKKTWEGTIGGALLCAVVMGCIGVAFDDGFVFGKPFLFWFGLCLLAAVVGTIGDLFESRLKRAAGVKDSGNIMPGHGGFLDRFDSLLLATPFIWLWIKNFVV